MEMTLFVVAVLIASLGLQSEYADPPDPNTNDIAVKTNSITAITFGAMDFLEVRMTLLSTLWKFSGYASPRASENHEIGQMTTHRRASLQAAVSWRC